MNIQRVIVLLGLVLVAAGCAFVLPKETRFLNSAQGRATQEEVKRQLGAPELTASNPDGESVWVYRLREQQPGNRMTSPGLWCDEYVLTFDYESVLRSWTHRSHFHGGELMPAYCVPGGYLSKS